MLHKKIASLLLFTVLSIQVSLLGQTNNIKFVNTSNQPINAYYLADMATFGHPIQLAGNDSVNIHLQYDNVLYIADVFQTFYIIKQNGSYKFKVQNGREFLLNNSLSKVEAKEFYFFEKLIESTGVFRNRQPINFVQNDFDHRQPYIDSLYSKRIAFLNAYFHQGENAAFHIR